MSRSHPKLGVVNIRAYYFLKSTLAVFALDEFNELIVNQCALWIEKATSWTELMKEEKLLVLFYNQN